ncbi:MAG: Arc family DNA-binding protein [Candidatus Electrothrix sp. ATG2]|nr:Arc family DNA-binding protein [Candidatus Electrothrix sp. ATG2]
MMPSVTVKNIPDHTFELLKQTATAHRRSMNSEIICLIEKAIISKPFNPERFLVQAKRSRQKTKDFLLTDDILQTAKGQGRP